MTDSTISHIVERLRNAVRLNIRYFERETSEPFSAYPGTNWIVNGWRFPSSKARCGIAHYVTWAIGRLNDRSQSLSQRLQEWRDEVQANDPPFPLFAEDLVRRLEDILSDEIRRLDPVPEDDCSHSQDFRSVSWFGTTYTFTPMQAACIQELWQAWESQSPCVGQDVLLAEAESESPRLRDLFKSKKMHPAWKSMIRSCSRGMYRLSRPDESTQ